MWPTTRPPPFSHPPRGLRTADPPGVWQHLPERRVGNLPLGEAADLESKRPMEELIKKAVSDYAKCILAESYRGL